MNVLLIYPYFLDARPQGDDIRVVPLGLYSIGALLRSHGHDVEIADWHDNPGSTAAIQAQLRQRRPDIIGISIVHANRWGGIDIARAAKAVFPGVPIVFGGVGATHLWKHLLTHFHEIDCVVLGEGEITFLELVDCLASGEKHRIASIAGLALRNSGRPFKTRVRELIRNLDELPGPADTFTYRHVALTRGCEANCTFCGSPRFWGRRVRSHSADTFVSQLETLASRGVTTFHISDDTFTLNPERVLDICRRIIDKEMAVNWTAISRVDLISEELLQWMRKAGCTQISYGVESGSAKIRRRLGKRFTDSQIKRAFAMTQRYGIMARAYFIYGCPGETDGTIAETIELMHAIQPLSTIFYILDIFPGTALYADMLRRLRLTDDIWLERIEDILYFETDKALSRAKILEWGRRLRSAFHRHLPRYVEALDLVNLREFYPLHADFCSRLGMTFEQGDYARPETVGNGSEIAGHLFRKALSYHPEARAYLGLAIQRQKAGDHPGALAVLNRGLAQFPHDARLNICLGVSCMNLGRFRQALEAIQPHDTEPQVLPLLAACCSELGLDKQADSYLKRLKRLSQSTTS